MAYEKGVLNDLQEIESTIYIIFSIYLSIHQVRYYYVGNLELNE